MTIRKGEDWGRLVPRPAALRVVDSDRELAVALGDGTGRPVLAHRGDLARTLGSAATAGRDTLNELPIDLFDVRLEDGSQTTGVAHTVARRPRRAGSWFRGEVVFVMNAQFLGNWNLVPRGHPNDGRLDVLRVDPAVDLRQRIQAARRAAVGGHLPHPGLTLTRVAVVEITFPTAMEVVVDGVARGITTTLHVAARPDAAVVHA